MIDIDIVLITYNHGDYIETCLNSVVKQDIFKSSNVLLWIGDDCSTDNTSSICERFAREHSFIRYVRRDRNIGVAENFISLLQMGSATYIALLEGDDYWIRQDKLSSQLYALRSNQGATLSFTNCFMHHSIGKGKDRLYVPNKLKRNIVLSTLLKFPTFAHTSTLVIKRSVVEDKFSYLEKCVVGDIPLTIWALRKNAIGVYVDMTSSVYRKHDGGRVHDLQKSYVSTRKNIILFYESIEEEKALAYRKILELYIEIAEYSCKDGMIYSDFKYSLLEALKLTRYFNLYLFMRLIRLLVRMPRGLALSLYSRYVQR